VVTDAALTRVELGLAGIRDKRAAAYKPIDGSLGPVDPDEAVPRSPTAGAASSVEGTRSTSTWRNS